MSDYVAGLACLALVLSPLFIPIAVTVVHWIRTWGHIPRAPKPVVVTQRGAPEPKTAPLAEPARRVLSPQSA
jgi:hypothetical protein